VTPDKLAVDRAGSRGRRQPVQHPAHVGRQSSAWPTACPPTSVQPGRHDSTQAGIVTRLSICAASAAAWVARFSWRLVSESMGFKPRGTATRRAGSCPAHGPRATTRAAARAAPAEASRSDRFGACPARHAARRATQGCSVRPSNRPKCMRIWPRRDLRGGFPQAVATSISWTSLRSDRERATSKRRSSQPRLSGGAIRASGATLDCAPLARTL